MFVGLTDITPLCKASPQVNTANRENMTKENFLSNPDCTINVVPMADNAPANHINYFGFRVLIAFVCASHTRLHYVHLIVYLFYSSLVLACYTPQQWMSGFKSATSLRTTSSDNSSIQRKRSSKEIKSNSNDDDFGICLLSESPYRILRVIFCQMLSLFTFLKCNIFVVVAFIFKEQFA